jgi:phage terminase large subunit-like protein
MPRKGSKKNYQISNALREEYDQLRVECENDLYTFALTMQPNRLYGDVHKEIFDFLGNFISHNKLLLIPRDHQKSHCFAVFAAWLIARDPTITILYLSSTSALAIKQVYAIKNILEDETFQILWPDMLHPDVGAREKWTTNEFNVDHPLRKLNFIRDATLTAGGITKTITGLHPNVILCDDLVVGKNAYTEEGRSKLEDLYSQLASIESASGYNIMCGTRYHPKDLYQKIEDMEEEVYGKNGELLGKRKVYDTFRRVVETDGVFLWPKEKGPDGKEWGMDMQLLATKKAKYIDQTQFYAQYYNNPNMGGSHGIRRDMFNYKDRSLLKIRGGYLNFVGRRLNCLAAMDCAYSLSKTADYTAISVGGMDADRNVFALEVCRFRTDDVEDYFKAITYLQNKWSFKKLVVETNGPQGLIVKQLKEKLRDNGSMINIIEHKPHSKSGDKMTRINNILNPIYTEGRAYHFLGEGIELLEEELIVAYPNHDDCKDSWAVVVKNLIPPARHIQYDEFEDDDYNTSSLVIGHPRFGGVIGRSRNVR